MKSRAWVLAAALAALGTTTAEAKDQSLLQVRDGYETKLTRQVSEGDPLDPPPPGTFSLVQFRTDIGAMGAYLSQDPEPGKKHPAIVWITGGFPPGGIDDIAWEPVGPDNDQSAKSYRDAGIVTMYPTLRGSFGNPGKQEAFYGEVNDVIAAAEFLETVDYVDPDRIYLGGHSTGGTLVLLVAEATDVFAGVIAFGPVDDPAGYGPDVLWYDLHDAKEARLRAPIHFLGAIESPTFVIEGTLQGNIDSCHALRRACRNPRVRFFDVKGGSHFDILAPLNRMIARRIAALAPGEKLDLRANDTQAAYDEFWRTVREASDLRTLASVRGDGIDLETPQPTQHFLLARDRDRLETAAKEAKAAGFEARPIEEHKGRDGSTYYVLILSERITLGDLDRVFRASKALSELEKKHDLLYDGWAVEPSEAGVATGARE